MEESVIRRIYPKAPTQQHAKMMGPLELNRSDRWPRVITVTKAKAYGIMVNNCVRTVGRLMLSPLPFQQPLTCAETEAMYESW